MRFARPLSLITGVAIAAASLSAQEGRQRAGGGAPRLIVRAVANGTPVADLKAEDISIRIDGKPREVKALELVTAGSGAPAAEPAAKAEPAPTLPAPFDTNVSAAPAASAPSGGREFLIMIDEDGIAPGQEDPVRKAVARIMSEATESDRFGLMSLRLGGKQIPGRASVTEALSKLVGGGMNSENTVDFTCRSKRTIDSIASAMQASPAGRTLIVITSGLAATPSTVQAIRPRTNAQTGEIDNAIPETCQIRSNDLEAFGATAALSPANTFFVHFPQGMPAQENQQAGQTGIENLAGVSNAEFIRLTGGNEPSLSRVVKETSSYYIATLDDAPVGSIRRIDARLNREGVKVIARPAAGRGSRPAAPTSAKGMSPRDMIANPAIFTDVPLRAASFVSRQGATDMKVVTLFEPVAAGTKLTAASVAVINEQDPSKATQLNLKPEELQRSPVAASLMIRPGRYRVRVAATTAEGGGTVDSTIVADLPAAGPMKTSSMLVGVTSDKGFAPKLQFTPEDKMVIGVLELYGVPSGGNVTTQFEIIESESAPPMGADAGRVQKGATEDSRMVIGGFGTETLQPGDYLMRIRISLDGKEVGTVTRTFRKTSGS